MVWQLTTGSALLGLCALLYVFCLALTGGLLFWIDEHYAKRSRFEQGTIIMAIGVLAVVFGHTFVVWIWAAAFINVGALMEMERALYFSLVTYTTLGYGDITLDAEHRLFGSMAAVSGLLNFGLSTAFLVAVLTRILARTKLHR